MIKSCCRKAVEESNQTKENKELDHMTDEQIIEYLYDLIKQLEKA